jgi:hypothetical protein
MAVTKRTGGGVPMHTRHRFNRVQDALHKKPTLQGLINARQNAHKSPKGAPQFPGFNTGSGIQAIRKLIKEQPRAQGFTFTAGAGVATQVQSIQLPGDARILLGLIFTTFAVTSDTFDFSINNNLIIKNGSCQLFAMNNSQSTTEQYFPYAQPLTGVDLIQITINSAAGQAGVVQLHFI